MKKLGILIESGCILPNGGMLAVLNEFNPGDISGINTRTPVNTEITVYTDTFKKPLTSLENYTQVISLTDMIVIVYNNYESVVSIINAVLSSGKWLKLHKIL